MPFYSQVVGHFFLPIVVYIFLWAYYSWDPFYTYIRLCSLTGVLGVDIIRCGISHTHTFIFHLLMFGVCLANQVRLFKLSHLIMSTPNTPVKLHNVMNL